MSSHAREQAARTNAIAMGTVTAAIVMNFVLAVLNALGLPVSVTVVTVVQLLLMIPIIVIVARTKPRVGNVFILAFIWIISWCAIAALYNGDLNPKNIYDLLVIPSFILLGLCVTNVSAKWLNSLVFSILSIGVVEAFASDVYTRLINPLAYFRATRAWVNDQSVGQELDSGLYMGAMRAGGSQFAFADHRIGSVFLEPVSLGYFALVCSLIYQQIYKHDRKKYFLAIGICVILSLMADSRIPTFIILVCALIGRVPGRFPVAASFGTPLLTLLFGFVLYSLGSDRLVFNDTFYRLSLTYGTLQSSSLADLIFGGVPTDTINDSGAIALVYTEGIFGAIVTIWMCCGLFNSRWHVASKLPIQVGLYVMTALLFGGALFSIKTAALLGFLIGVCAKGLDISVQPLSRRTSSAIRSPHTFTRAADI